MKNTRGNIGSAETDEVQRAAQETADRLRALGISLTGHERAEELLTIEEAIERFEIAVEEKGGDLMVDEPPPGSFAQPDDWHFALPRRHPGESVADYVGRLELATEVVKQHPPRGE